jgi:hypothetical protein
VAEDGVFINMIPYYYLIRSLSPATQTALLKNFQDLLHKVSDSTIYETLMTS